MERPRIAQLLWHAADWLEAHGLYKGHYHWGQLLEDLPKHPPLRVRKRARAINAWPADKVWYVAKADLMGALMVVAGHVGPDDEYVLTAIDAVRRQLHERDVVIGPCGWSDAPRRTKYEVAELLRHVARGLQ